MDLHNQGKPSLRMKTILLLILSAFTAFAATTYPVLTDNANRTFSGGATNLALLNGTNVFTGTNTFSGPVTFTSPAFYTNNGVFYRKLWQSPTNIYISNVVGIPANDVTNNGDYVRCTPVFAVEIPPLISRSSLLIYFQGPTLKTNVNASNASMFIGIGTNTNCIGRSTFANTAIGASGGSFFTLTANANSFTNQSLVAGVFGVTAQNAVSNYFDSTITNTVYFGAYTASATEFTNLLIYGVQLWELVVP